MNQIEKINSMKYTENGDKAYKLTGDNLLDILFMTSYFEKYPETLKLGKSDREKLFAMMIRDPRYGLGRRDLGRELMKLSSCSPEEIVKAGRYDDLVYIASDEALEYLRSEIEKDNELAKKWAPRLTGRDSRIAKALAKHWEMSEKEYRAFIKCDSTVEYKLSYAKAKEPNPLEKAFDKVEYEHPLAKTIEFEHIPSLAMLKYFVAFSSREDLRERFTKYLEAVKSGKKKLNVSTTNVYDIYRNRNRIDADLFFDKIEKINISCIPVIDTSGSMEFDDAMGKAMSIGHYLARCSSFCNGYAVAFSERPRLLKLKGETYSEQIKSLYTGDCSNTDLGRVMNLFKRIEEFPDYLVILSDMEFDEGSAQSKDELMELWKEKGYKTKIIWWNFDTRNKTATETDEYGNIFISGYSPMLLKYLEAGFDGKAFLKKLLDEYAQKMSIK